MRPSPARLRWSLRRAQNRAETVSAESSPTVNPAEKADVENDKDIKVANLQVHCKRQNPAEQAVHFDTADQLEQQASEQDLRIGRVQEDEGNGHEDD